MLSSFLNWSKTMAQFLKAGVRRPKYELPEIELVSVSEDSISSGKRRADIHQILARLHVLSHRRGRPSTRQKDEEVYAA